jgi:hypothetical protein
MEMEQILACLVGKVNVMQERMEAKIEANQEKMYAKMDTNQENMDSEMNTNQGIMDDLKTQAGYLVSQN